jgi:transglutaminase-like putative cysteine protease
MHRWLAGCGLAVAVLGPSLATGAEPEGRWVAATPDAMIDLSQRAALRDGADALARVLLIDSLLHTASAGKSAKALEVVAASNTSVAADARWLRRTHEPSAPVAWTGMGALPLTETGAPQWPGLARSFLLLGPFEDTGGGLLRKEGPELNGHRFVGADYSRGVYAVRPQRSTVSSVTPRGLPLDLYVLPRSESCTYLSTVVQTPGTPFVIHIASGGALKALWDGEGFMVDESQHGVANVDRAAATVTTTAGEHLLTLKVCTGARGDGGRVRVRFSDVDDQDLVLPTNSAPAKLDAVLARIKRRRPASNVVARATSLERSRPTGDPSLERSLIAAVVSTLAGADDQRSLTAPGQLDRVVGDPAVNADRMALAGWIATFGANRSGWLASAMRRAGHDAATKDFAQRALVSYRLSAGAVDLAKATMEQAPLSKASDAHASWLRARVKDALGGEGLEAKAYADMRAIADSKRAATPMVVWVALARMAGSRQASSRLAALQHLAEGLPERRGPSYVGAYRMSGAASFERAAMQELLNQTRVSSVTGLAAMLFDAGRYPAAKQAFALAAHLAPNYARAHTGLASTMRAMDPTSANSDAVLALLARASELQPQNTELTAELRFRRGDPSGEPEAGEDAQYIVEPAVFLARAKANPMPGVSDGDQGGVFSRQLHWRRVVRMHADKRVSQLMHYAREIGIEPRTESERRENLPGGHGTELLLARVHRRDGSVHAPEEQDSSGPSVRWPKLKRGDVVEIAVRTWTRGPVGRRGDAPFYFMDYVGSTDTRPVLYNEVVIDVPDGSAMAFDVIGGVPDERRVERSAGRTVTHLIWTAPPSIPDEPLSPRVTELVPVVAGSVYSSWDSFLAWYDGAVEGFTTPDEQIQRLAAEITDGKLTREQKVEALFNFVSDDIRYVNFVSGEWWLPNRPQQLLARRQGDCDDKAMLLISLLRAVNIEATEVLVQTRHTAQRRIMQSDRVAIPMFDHGIIYLPDEDGEGGRFLDATSPKSRIGTVPAMDSGAMALKVRKGERVQPTPAASINDHGVTARWKLELASDGSGTLRADETHVGDRAFRLRTHLGEEDARAQWVEGNLIGSWFPGLEIHPDVSFEGDLSGGRARVRYRATSRSLARHEGDDLLVTIAPPTPVAMRLAPLLTRTLPVELPASIAPQHRRVVVEIIAPQSYRFAELPPDAVEDGGSFGKASLKLVASRDGKKVTLTRDMSLAQSRIPVADYQRWRKWLKRIDALLQRSVRLQKRP